MRKLIIITWLVALAFTVNAFAQGGYQNIQTVNGQVSLATNISVVTVPTKIAGSDGAANVRVVINTGTSVVNLLLTTATTATATVTNQLSGALGTIPIAAGTTNVFKRGGVFELWSGYIYGQSASGTTNAVVYLGLKP